MKWDPSEHPRDAKGQFTEKWVGLLAAHMGKGIAGGPTHDWNTGAAVGYDIRDRLNYEDLADLLYELPTPGEGDPDVALEAIYKLQGFDGKPKVWDQMEMDLLIEEDGWIEAWRGVGPLYRLGYDEMTPKQIHDMYRYGDRHYGGSGMHGNGTYTASNHNTAWSEYSIQGDPEAVMRFAISPRARIVTKRALEAEREQDEAWADEETNEDRFAIFKDLGRFAAARGYDVIKVESGYERPYYVILNRTVTAVQDKPYVEWIENYDSLED